MPYSTIENLIDLMPESRLLELVDDNDEGEFIIVPPNAPYNKVLAAIKKADGIIDSQLGSSYVIPLSAPIADVIVGISSDLAFCNLYKRSHDMDKLDGIEIRKKDAMAELKKIVDGVSEIPGLKTKDPGVFLTNKTESDIEFSDSVMGSF